MIGKLTIILSPATATAISTAGLSLATLAGGPVYAQQANTPLVNEFPPDSLAALISAAEQGYAPAQLSLGVMYATGEGVPADSAEAVRWYRAAAEQGHAPAQFSLGVEYALGWNGSRGRRRSRPLVPRRRGTGPRPPLSSASGSCTPPGRGFQRTTPKPSAGSAPLRNRATFALSASSATCTPTGCCRFQRTTPKLSAGTAPAQNRATLPLSAASGVMYANGEGVPENYVLAYAWMNLAGAQGDVRAQEAKDRLARRMTSEQVARAQELSIELLRTINQP